MQEMIDVFFIIQVKGRFNFEVHPPKFIKEPRSRGCEAQAFSRSCVNFLTAIREIHCGVNSLRFFRKILQGAALSEIMAVGHLSI